jgi:hypothetical protein
MSQVRLDCLQQCPFEQGQTAQQRAEVCEDERLRPITSPGDQLGEVLGPTVADASKLAAVTTDTATGTCCSPIL